MAATSSAATRATAPHHYDGAGIGVIRRRIRRDHGNATTVGESGTCLPGGSREQNSSCPQPPTGAWLTDAERSRAGQAPLHQAADGFPARPMDAQARRGAASSAGRTSRPRWRGSRGARRQTARRNCYVDGQRAARGVSLSDRAGCAVCLVTAEPADVGCDIEIVEPRSAAFVRDYLTEREARFVEAAGEARDMAANLFWSAKESALKVLRTGLRRDTRSVEVTVADLRPPEFTWSPLEVRTVEGPVFPGWWRRSGPFLFTVCARGDGPGPRRAGGRLTTGRGVAVAQMAGPPARIGGGRPTRSPPTRRRRRAAGSQAAAQAHR